MAWIAFKDRQPTSYGEYLTVEKDFTSDSICFTSKIISYRKWEVMLSIESDDDTKRIYLKKACFTDGFFELDKNCILYWYELDPIPED